MMTNIIRFYSLSSFHKSLETKGGLTSNFLIPFTRLHTPPSPNHVLLPGQQNIPHLFLLESCLSFTPIFFHGNKTFISSSFSWFYISNSFIILIQTRKNTYKDMICTCCVIGLEVQMVQYRHIRMIFFLFVTLLKLSFFWILE